MDSLRVRAYNVRFGDALLVTVPDRGPDGAVTERNILIDVGNVLAGGGGEDEVFEPVIADILEQLDGRPLDLYVMTHEHMDHVQGLLWAKEKKGLEIRATHAWLTASAAPDYYDRFPEAKKKRLAMEDAYARIALHFAAAKPSPSVEALLLNNNPRSTADCIEHLRGVGEATAYVHRETDVAGTHPFAEAEFELWGPEENTSSYYGSFRPMGLAAGPLDGEGEGAAPAPAPDPLPPPGVDAGAFYNLVKQRRAGIFDNLRSIDKAANDTSIVFLLTWRGWRLLFPGDAEERSWKEMGKRGLLGPVHFLKVGHHGSHNGTPGGELLDTILPLPAPDGRPRKALVSTHEGTYNNVPDGRTLEELGRRCEVVRIGEDGDALFTDLFFPDPQST
jgi:beta-lactamase superfamily II metal-dependent hydrolase